MARSHAIWVVTSDSYSWPMGAFTVKHELITWLRKQDEEQRLWFRVWYCIDNPGRDEPIARELDTEELMK